MRKNAFPVALIVAALAIVAVGYPINAAQRPRLSAGNANKGALSAGKIVQESAAYSYGSAKFTGLIDESYKEVGAGSGRDFYKWFDKAYKESKFHYPGYEKLDIGQLLEMKKKALSNMKNPAKRADMELKFAAWMHRMVKTVIPRFSLDRGYEFFHVTKYGERQCLLQSVLIAAMLQKAGINAGAVMVFRNLTGGESNNGHVVTLLKLANNEDIIVDASEQTPYAEHRGLFVRSSGYVYVTPIYKSKSSRIAYYQSESNHKRIPDSEVLGLDYKFLQSQFWFYRGERVKGGLLFARHTPRGLKAEERALAISAKVCPRNPLSVYMLGRTYLAEGKIQEAGKCLRVADKLYASDGWVPAGVKEYLAQATH